MLKIFGGGVLVLVSLFMLIGFFRSSVAFSAQAMLAVAIAVVLPASAGVALLVSHFKAGARMTRRRDELRDQTIASEVLRLAADRGGRLTLVEVVTEMALPSEVAQGALDALVHRELADIAVTDSGVLVYTFRDIERLGDKAHARGILE